MSWQHRWCSSWGFRAVNSTMASAKRSAPVFVVGVPRSGTTLLTALLGAHSRLSCSPESAFFAKLSKSNIDELLDSSHWPVRALDFLYSIRIGDVPVPDRYAIPREALISYLKSRRPSPPAMLEALTQQYMIAVGKRRWVEKTPKHLVHASMIRRYYPHSPIIRIVRDPRDLALSLMSVPFGTNTFLGGLS